MSKKEYRAKILEIRPGAGESQDYLVDAFVKFEVDGLQFWAFVPNWTHLFPYPLLKRNIHPLGYGRSLLQKLKGREAIVYFKLSSYKFQKIVAKKKSIVWVKENTVNFEILGEVVRLQEGIASNPNYAGPLLHELTIDCGILLTTTQKAGIFRKGDFGHFYGRLDAEFLWVDEKIERSDGYGNI